MKAWPQQRHNHGVKQLYVLGLQPRLWPSLTPPTPTPPNNTGYGSTEFMSLGVYVAGGLQVSERWTLGLLYSAERWREKIELYPILFIKLAYYTPRLWINFEAQFYNPLNKQPICTVFVDQNQYYEHCYTINWTITPVFCLHYSIP